MVHFDVITIFPGMFDSPLQEGIIKRAQQKKIISIAVHDLRDYTEDKHRTVDDTPYGGGAGMVMKVEPIAKALENIARSGTDIRKVLTTPQGVRFSQETARRLSGCSQIVLVCGRYEGVDERVGSFVDEEISIGDFILSGGELAAMVIIDATARLVNGVVGDITSVEEDTFAGALLKHPQYTRPENFRGYGVPGVLLSGDHRRINAWRRTEALRRTLRRRPDLLHRAALSEEDLGILDHITHSDTEEFIDECN